MFGLKLKEKMKKQLTKKNLLWGFVVLFLLVNFIQIHRTIGTFSHLQGTNSSLISEVGEIRQTYLDIGKDLNEVRQFLRLPTSSYLTLQDTQQGEKEADQNTDTVQLALFKYIDYLAANQMLADAIERNTGILDQLAVSEDFAIFLEDGGLKFSVIEDEAGSSSLEVLNADDEMIMSLYLDPEDGNLYRKTVKAETKLETTTFQNFYAETVRFLSANKVGLEQYLDNVTKIETVVLAVLNDAAVIEKMAELEVSIDENWRIYNDSDVAIGEIFFDKSKLELNLVDLNETKNSKTTKNLKMDIFPYLEALDTATLIEKKASNAMTSLKKTFSDPGFKLLLDNNGLKLSSDPREDEDRVYFDIYTKSGRHISSLVVEKKTGVINIVQPDGTNSENILFFDPEFKKKTLEIPKYIPEYDDVVSGDKDFNILIAGKHGSLIDTMIFAHVNEETQKIKMISIPRDLWYQGRKINAYASSYGMPELKKVISNISGYQLDKYILIDMYAFIDVVDLIGGIDITLDKAVVDPTYRTVDNGVEGTLNYPPGDYHLGGKEALRLARTRHTSSDFARAERQQMILEALQDKARNFGFGDADTIYSIAKTVLGKTETDISLDESLAYYFRYQNYDIISNDVMSSGNVLYVPPYITTENCSAMTAAAKAAGESDPGCTNENHAYTLLPRDNNWNVIKWFFREKFDNL